nr:YfbM family protein [uncultured Niameybacter sp.]
MSMVGYYRLVDDKELEKLKLNEIDNPTFMLSGEDILEIDQAWHLLHYVLTGDVDVVPNNPLSLVVLGGTPANNNNLGYGPLTYLNKAEVQAAYEALECFLVEDLREKVSVKEMAQKGVYPVFNEAEDEEELYEYVLFHLKELKDFFKKAVGGGKNSVFLIG